MTIAPDHVLRSGGSCFLTVHASVLCFAGAGFTHIAVTDISEASELVVASAPPAMLRALGQPARVALEHAAMAGRPPGLDAAASGHAATVNLSMDGAFLSAGDTGGAVVRVDAAHRWEEFLAISPATLGRLRDVTAHDWVALHERRLERASDNRILPDFALRIGGRPISLRDADLLDGGAPDRMALCAEGRLGILQRVKPVLVVRHDGTAEADAEIELALASLAMSGGFPGRVVAEMAGRPEGFEGVASGGLDIRARPAAGAGLLHFGTDAIGPDEGPVLFLANGVLFDGPAAPIVAAAACLPRIAAAPWLRGAWEILPALGAEALDPAIVAGPSGRGWDALDGLVEAARGLVSSGDLEGAAALQLALAAYAPLGPNPLRGFVAAGGPDAASDPRAARGLLNLRSVPREIRAEVMRACVVRQK